MKMEKNCKNFGHLLKIGENANRGKSFKMWEIRVGNLEKSMQENHMRYF